MATGCRASTLLSVAVTAAAASTSTAHRAVGQDFPSGYLLKGVTSAKPMVLLGGEVDEALAADTSRSWRTRLQGVLVHSLKVRKIPLEAEGGISFPTAGTLVCELSLMKGVEVRSSHDRRLQIHYSSNAYFIDRVQVVGRAGLKPDVAIVWKADSWLGRVDIRSLYDRLRDSVERCADEFASTYWLRNAPS